MSDVYSANTVLLLHMEGANNSTTFTDSSSVSKTITRYGDTKISATQSKWGQGSGYFDGTGDYLSVPYSTSFDFGSGDLTIEAWIYISGNSSLSVSSRSASIANTWSSNSTISGWNLSILGSATTTGTGMVFSTWSSGDATEYYANTSISQNAWHHIAVTVQSGVRRLFLDGVLLSGSTNTYGSGYTQVNAFTALNIGKTLNSGYQLPLLGYLQDLRITKDIARYTADFTPPAARLPDPDPATGLIIPSGYRRDIYDGGAYRITGNVDELGVAGSYRVRLFDRQSARCLRETWSAADGSYSFLNLAYRYQGYFVVAFDHGDSPLNAAIADLITPEAMP